MRYSFIRQISNFNIGSKYKMPIETKSGLTFCEDSKEKTYFCYTFFEKKVKVDMTMFDLTSRAAFKIRDSDILFETLEDVGLYLTEIMGKSTLPQPTTKKSTIFHGIGIIKEERWYLVGCMPLDLMLESRTLGYFRDKKLSDSYFEKLTLNYPLGMNL